MVINLLVIKNEVLNNWKIRDTIKKLKIYINVLYLTHLYKTVSQQRIVANNSTSP